MGEQYKVGDWLVCTKTEYGKYKVVGDVFQKIESSYNDDTYIYFASGSSITYDRVRLAKRHEIPNYKPNYEIYY